MATKAVKTTTKKVAKKTAKKAAKKVAKKAVKKVAKKSATKAAKAAKKSPSKKSTTKGSVMPTYQDRMEHSKSGDSQSDWIQASRKLIKVSDLLFRKVLLNPVHAT